MSKIIENIGILDVREADKDLLSQLSEIRNIGTYITNDQIEMSSMHISKHSIGSVVKYDGQVENIMVNGKETITKDTISDDAKYIIAVNGKCCIEKDIDLSFMKDKLLSCSVNGKLYLPSSLSSIKSKFTVNGKIVEYDAEMTLIDSTVVLTNEYLESYFGDANIAVNKLIMVEALDMSLVEEDLSKIQVLGQLITTKSNAKKMKHMINVNQSNIKIVPENIYYVDENSKLDDGLIDAADGKDIYVSGKLSISDLNVLDRLNDSKILADEIKCDEESIQSIKPYCLSDKQKFKVNKNHQGMANYESFRLDKAYLESLKDKSRFENYGDLKIDESVTSVAMTHDFKIANYGTIYANSDTKAWVYANMNENYGHIKVEGEEAKEGSAQVIFGNMGYLKL